MNSLEQTHAAARRTQASAVIIAVVAALLAAALVAAPTADARTGASGTTEAGAAAKAQVDAPVPTVAWSRCTDSNLDCARVAVPLDYDDPDGPTTSIFMSRHRATDQAGRIGTLFVNPGGPGGPSSEVTGIFARELGRRITAKFDIVGIDPRGVGESTPLVCRSSKHAPRSTVNTVPLNAKQARPLLRISRYVSKACAEKSNAILDHMTTADTARDMDLVRQALGDDQLSYYGISYGSYLGATYAAMFPGRVRAMVIDGVLDPVGWSTGRNGNGKRVPFSSRLGSGFGAWEALVSAFHECDRVGKARCRFAGKAADQWRDVIGRLRKGPVWIEDWGTFDYADMVNLALGALYDRANYRLLFRITAQVHREMFDPQRRAKAEPGLADSVRRLSQPEHGPYGLGLDRSYGPRQWPAFEGVACADSINPSNPRRWIKAGRLADRAAPWFGRAWNWLSASCATWPGSKSDGYRGPWHKTTANPLMIVGNLHDPATPINGARVAHRLFKGSRMVTLKTWGHGALGQSACVTRRMSDYLVAGTLPPKGLVCRPDKQLFPARR